MSDILKKFKSVFIIEDEPSPRDQPSAETAPDQGPAKAEAPPTAPSVPTAPPSGSLNKQFVEILAGALEKNNQEGFDYFEFRQALANLAKMQMDEPTRYKSAYAMAQTMGVTADKLVASAQFYINVLSGEEARFNEAHAQQRTKMIGNQESGAQKLQELIRQKTEQINQLTKEIADHQKESEQILKQVSDATVKIESTKADFDTTFASVVGQLQADVAKIQQHLK